MKQKLISIEGKDPLSIRQQCDLLAISRSTFYYVSTGEKPENLEMMELMDKHILEEPTAGVLTMQSCFSKKGMRPDMNE